MAILCYCGKELVHKTGVSKKWGKPYAMWSCSGFPGCNATPLQPDEYDALLAKGTKQLPKPDKMTKKAWTNSKNAGKLPRQKNNQKSKNKIPYRMLTAEQEMIIEAFIHNASIFFVKADADAGVGKTTLAKQIAARIRALPSELTTGIIMAFSATPSKELMAELPANWVSATVHSCGNNAVCAFYGLEPMGSNEYKTSNILRAEYGEPENVETKALYTIVGHIVDMMKNQAWDENVSTADIVAKAKYYNKTIHSDVEQMCSMARKVIAISRSPEGIRDHGHDFADQIWLPVINNLPIARYRYVIVDEAQDSNICRMIYAIRSLLPGGKLLFVGDKDQAIFGFTGADTTAMDTFADRIVEMTGLPVHSYPITVNWRCPSIIIELTQLIHPSIKARPNAPRGSVHIISDDQLLDIVKPGDVILSRINANLIRTAYQLIKKGIGAVVLGRKIGQNIKDLIEKLSKDKDGNYCSTVEMLVRANAWLNAEFDIIAAKNVRNPEPLYQDAQDRYDCIAALCGVEIDNGKLKSIGIPSIPRLKQKIDEIFGEMETIDRTKVVVLSTVHKFKGGQCWRIFALDAAANHPHPMAESEWELDQEMHILYVLVTRTGDGTDRTGQALFFVNGMPAALVEKGGMSLVTEYVDGNSIPS